YVGPVLTIALASPLILRIVRLAKSQNITSIADFIAARYGKHQGVAAIVALIAIVGTIPYIALQLKAVSSSLSTILGPFASGPAARVRRHRAAVGGGDGLVRDPVRHTPHRRDRASARPDARHRGRVAGQADRVPGGRRVRHLRDVRRPGGAVHRGNEAAASCGG